MALLRISAVLFCLVAIVYAKSHHHRVNENAKEELEAYIYEKMQEVNPRYRLLYHPAPPVGWMNDPNGFSYYKGEYHLFYQYYPYDTIWGPMHWGHFSSPDLVQWNQLPTALVPDEEQCFSGSAVVDGDQMILMYTGHRITDRDPFFNQSQYLAYSDDGIEFTKYKGNPVLPAAPNNVDDFRDPKVWKHEDYWYVIIGSKTEKKMGRVLLYRSRDMKQWEFLTVLAESQGDMGYMWECPDFFELNGKHILLMSPQGMKSEGDKFNNLYQTGYIVGEFNYDTFEFKQLTEFTEIDLGHDFYAAQTTKANDKTYMIGWFAMWEDPHPEDKDGWVNAMTIVRELELTHENKIISRPVEAISKLRDEVVIEGKLQFEQELQFKKAAEMIITGDLTENINIKFEGQSGGDKVLLQWDPSVRKVVLNRNGNIRQREWTPILEQSFRIFLDSSSIEVFCGEGELVFSSRAYPEGSWKVTSQNAQVLLVQGYNLKRSVPENFIR